MRALRLVGAAGRSCREAISVVVTLLVVVPGCGRPGNLVGSQLSVKRGAVVVGTDDRIEWFEVEDAMLRSRLASSSAALVYAHRLHFDAAGPMMDAPTLGQELNLCEGERFREQPSWSFCSGTLIDRDLLLTAGHCLGDDLPQAQQRCERLHVVFNYHVASGDSVQGLSPADVYSCRKVVVHQSVQSQGNPPDAGDAGAAGAADFAIIQLDRDATPDHAPVTVGSRVPVAGDALTIAGYGAGLPMKVELAAQVTALLDSERFIAATDTFAGSSGSGLYDADLSLIGFHVSGDADWVLDDSCSRASVVTVSQEQHQRPSTALRALCNSGWPTSALCGSADRCGDGICGAGEHDTCTADCAPPSCGDGLCDLSEGASCPADCDSYRDVPASWSDDPQIYREMAASIAGGTTSGGAGGCALSPVGGGASSDWPLVILLVCAICRLTARRSAQGTMLTKPIGWDGSSPRLILSPEPNRPESLSPQHFTPAA
jgi:V8-like Glu-specific endopeptidase